MTITDIRPAGGIALEFTIHDRLRKARLNYSPSISQDAFGDLIGASGSTVSNYELGATVPERMKKIYLREWARVTGVSYRWLETGEVGLGGFEPPTFTVEYGRLATVTPINRAA